MSDIQEQPHTGHTGTATVVLTELADSLIVDLANHPSGRVARTILTGSVMRAAVIALKQGASMSEHDSPPAATLYVIRGHVTVRAGEREWTLTEGELIPIPPQRHGVQAHADSAVLLTVALR
ncbi:MAG: cupin domain-containing protein [Nocardioidaceae bacterium]